LALQFLADLAGVHGFYRDRSQGPVIALVRCLPFGLPWSQMMMPEEVTTDRWRNAKRLRGVNRPHPNNPYFGHAMFGLGQWAAFNSILESCKN
jgi:hypothetical protein